MQLALKSATGVGLVLTWVVIVWTVQSDVDSVARVEPVSEVSRVAPNHAEPRTELLRHSTRNADGEAAGSGDVQERLQVSPVGVDDPELESRIDQLWHERQYLAREIESAEQLADWLLVELGRCRVRQFVESDSFDELCSRMSEWSDEELQREAQGLGWRAAVLTDVQLVEVVPAKIRCSTTIDGLRSRERELERRRAREALDEETRLLVDAEIRRIRNEVGNTLEEYWAELESVLGHERAERFRSEYRDW